MNEVVLNGNLRLQYPDGFQIMDEAEQKRVFNVDTSNRWCIQDSDRNIMIAATWNTSNKLLARISSPKDQAKRVEARARKAYKDRGYRRIEFSKTKVAGRDAHTVSFECHIMDADQVVEVIVFYEGATYFFIYCYTQKANAAENRKVIDEVLASCRFS